MQEIIKTFENKINDLELSIKSSYEFARVPGCEITYSGYEMIHRQKEELKTDIPKEIREFVEEHDVYPPKKNPFAKYL